MKFIHLSDLHLGKRLHGRSLLEDQRDILEKIAAIAREERPDAVLIAGDIYDRPIPPEEAVRLFDDFLVALAAAGARIFLISGNHDSAERISFGARLLEKNAVYIAPAYAGTLTPVTLEDAWGKLDVYLLPFVKPALVQRFFPQTEMPGCEEALAAVLGALALDPARRNVLVAHQFVTGSQRCESEELWVGGADNVDARVFAPFDYVALGHLHRPQAVGETLRYSGTPLKYSFSEEHDRKSVTVAELREKGALSVRTVPLTPLREMHTLRGTFEALCRPQDGVGREDYIHAVLTDALDVPDAAARLRGTYPNLLWLSRDDERARAQQETRPGEETLRLAPLALFAQFYEQRSGAPLTPEQSDYMRRLIEKVWGS